MSDDDSKIPLWLRMVLLPAMDGARPSTPLKWVSPVAPVVTQAAAGAGHWAAGRRQRALAEWAGAAGLGLVAWGLGTESPTLAEAEANIWRQQRELLSKLGTKAPPIPETEPLTTSRWSRFLKSAEPAFPIVEILIGVPWRLRHPRRLTVLTTAAEAPTVAFNVLRTARAVQRRRPRIAVGSALVVAGSVARLRAASTEPLQQN